MHISPEFMYFLSLLINSFNNGLYFVYIDNDNSRQVMTYLQERRPDICFNPIDEENFANLRATLTKRNKAVILDFGSDPYRIDDVVLGIANVSKKNVIYKIRGFCSELDDAARVDYRSKYGKYVEEWCQQGPGINQYIISSFSYPVISKSFIVDNTTLDGCNKTVGFHSAEKDILADLEYIQARAFNEDCTSNCTGARDESALVGICQNCYRCVNPAGCPYIAPESFNETQNVPPEPILTTKQFESVLIVSIYIFSLMAVIRILRDYLGGQIEWHNINAYFLIMISTIKIYFVYNLKNDNNYYSYCTKIYSLAIGQLAAMTWEFELESNIPASRNNAGGTSTCYKVSMVCNYLVSSIMESIHYFQYIDDSENSVDKECVASFGWEKLAIQAGVSNILRMISMFPWNSKWSLREVLLWFVQSFGRQLFWLLIIWNEDDRKFVPAYIEYLTSTAPFLLKLPCELYGMCHHLLVGARGSQLRGYWRRRGGASRSTRVRVSWTKVKPNQVAVVGAATSGPP